MAQVIISQLPPLPDSTGSGTPKGTDLTPATDTTDTTEAASGTTKKYTRSAELNYYLAAQGITAYTAVLASSTVALTVVYANGTLGVGATLTNAGAMAAITLDGVTLVVGDRVLIKNQAAPAQNGIYTVTTVGSGAVNWVLTRATDYDQAAEVIQYAVILSNQGTLNAGLLFQETGPGPFVMGTTDITFQACSGTSVSQGLVNELAFYAATGDVISGLTTANKAVLTSGATGVPVMTALATDGQFIIGSTAGVPAAATLTPGTGISIANAGNSITISATGGGFGVATVAGTTQAANVNTMYILLNAAQTTATLPATCSVGDTVILVGSTANVAGWILDAPAGDTVMFNGTATSAGGTITSSALAGQTIEVVCDVADTSWIVVDTVNTTLTTA